MESEMHGKAGYCVSHGGKNISHGGKANCHFCAKELALSEHPKDLSNGVTIAYMQSIAGLAVSFQDCP